MTSIPILDLVAGMIFIYFLLSIVCNSIFEGISSALKIRSDMLTKWLTANFPNLLGHFMDHTILKGTSEKGKSNSYLSASNFSLTLIDALSDAVGKVPETLSEISAALDTIANDPQKKDLLPADFQRVLQIMIAETKQASVKAGQVKPELEMFRAQVEKWFDSMMERVSGGYKRKAGTFAFAIAFVMSIGLNIDSIAIMNFLYSNPQARQALATAAYNAPGDTSYQKWVNTINTEKAKLKRDDSIAQAKRTAGDTSVVDTAALKAQKSIVTSLDSILAEVKQSRAQADTAIATISMYIPMGWNAAAKDDLCNDPWTKLGGLLITIFAVSLGAPFWFDMLSKLANLRSSLKPGSSTTKNNSSGS